MKTGQFSPTIPVPNTNTKLPDCEKCPIIVPLALGGRRWRMRKQEEFLEVEAMEKKEIEELQELEEELVEVEGIVEGAGGTTDLEVG